MKESMSRARETKTDKQKGFTLIEVLTVVAILTFLVSLTMTGFHIARQRARDVKRMADIQQLNKAIQLYILNTGHAPYMGDQAACSAQGGLAGNTCAVSDPEDRWRSALGVELSSYVAKLPVDPCGVKCAPNPGGSPWFTYTYVAPATLAFGCVVLFDPPCTRSVSDMDVMYQIYANTLERTGNNWGVNETMFSSL